MRSTRDSIKNPTALRRVWFVEDTPVCLVYAGRADELKPMLTDSVIPYPTREKFGIPASSQPCAEGCAAWASPCRAAAIGDIIKRSEPDDRALASPTACGSG